MLHSLKGAPPPPASPKPRPIPQPRFTVSWQPRWLTFQESLNAFFKGPKAPKNGVPSAYLRDTYVRPYWPSRAMMASVFWHVAVIFVLSLPIWQFAQARSGLTVPRIELTWTEPAADLPPLTFPGSPSQPGAQPGTQPSSSRAPSRPSPPGEPNKPLPRSGATAYHPRQTILSTPMRATHPRQTLVRPRSSPEPPKIAPQLPNIVEWSKSKSPKLQLRLSTGAAPKRPRNVAPPAGTLPPVPNVANGTNTPGTLNIAPSPIVNMQPRLPVPTSSAPQLNQPQKTEAEPAPEIGADTANKNADLEKLNINPNSAENLELKIPVSQNAAPRATRKQAPSEGGPPDLGPAISANESDNRQLLALSPTPAPPAPPPKVPEGNLSARMTISPEGTQPGAPGGSASGAAATTGNRGGGPGAMGGTGSAGGTKPAPASGTAGGTKPAPVGGTGSAGAKKPGPASGGGAGAGGAVGPGTVSISGGTGAGSSVSGPGGSATPSRTAPAVAKAAEPPKPPPEPVNPVRVTPKLGMERIDAAATPEQILGSKRVYTIYVNMPNLTSSAGSWVLNFAELRTDEEPGRPDTGDLSSPVPVRKVDPKYPQTMRNENVEGEVVLYAIIRRDGSVDSIQLLKGVEPELDQYAMEAFSRWKFRPANRHGVPVELETVVHIPFRNGPV
jgi:TonB family protein